MTNLVVYGPRFTRVDASLVKKATFTESTNLEFRVEALNVINNQNFKVGSFAAAPRAFFSPFRPPPQSGGG